MAFRNKKLPYRTYTLTFNGTDWKQMVIRPAHVNSFGVALEFFPNAQPGEHYEGNTYRYYVPTWGWLFITWRETIEDDYANPPIT